MARYSDKQKAALDALMKDEVFEHAMKIIAEEDLSALTMDRLATDVGVSRGTLYNYFADKDAVIDYLDERIFDPVVQAVEKIAVSDIAAGEKLTKIAEWIFGAIFKDRAFVMALSPIKQASAKRECKQQHRARALGTFQAVITSGMEKGEFRTLDPVLVSEYFLAEYFLAVISGLIESMSLSGNFLPAEEVVPPLMDIFLGGLSKSRP